MLTDTGIDNFFEIMGTKIKLAKEIRQYYGKQLAPDFNTLDFWPVNENKVSEILAFFLNPHAAHAQGDIYLKLFMKRFELDRLNITDINKLEMRCEYSTNEHGRFDILINYNSFEWAIVIENKIRIATLDQRDQVSGYIEHLKEKTKNNNYCVIYLGPKGKELAEHSIASDKRAIHIEEETLKLLNYEDDMIGCIKEFALITENVRVKSFLTDFENWLRKRYIIGGKFMDIQSTIANYAIKNEENLELAFLVADSLDEIKKRTQVLFEEQLYELAHKLGLDVCDVMNCYAGGLRPNDWEARQDVIDWSRYCIAFENGDNIFGIVIIHNEGNHNEIKEFIYNPEKPKDECMQRFKNFMSIETRRAFEETEYWPLYELLYENMNNSQAFYLDVISGRAKVKAEEKVTELLKLISQFGDARPAI